MPENYLVRFPLLSAEEIENSPSRKDGLTAAQETKLKRKAARNIYATSRINAENFPKMSSGTAALATTFFMRYFASHSMTRNSHFIIALVCLYLAGKVNDEPRGLDGLTQIMIRQWFGRDNPDLRARLNDPTFLVDLRQQAEDAEYLLMLALGFDFNVDLLIPTCARLVARVDALKMLRGNFHFQQFMVAACNDIMQRDPMLVLQYPSSSIAAGVIQLYFKLARQQKLKLEQPPSAGDGEHPWYVSEGVSVETHAEIEGRFLANVYVQVENKGGKDAAAGSQNSAPTTTTTTFDGTNSHGGLGTMLNSQDITKKSNLKVPMDHERERERTRHEPCDWLNPKYSGGDGVTGGLSISQVHGPNNRYETAIRNAPPPPVTQEDSDLEEGEIR